MLGSAFLIGRVLLVGLVLSVESVHPVIGKGVMGNDGLCLRSDHAGRDDPQERIGDAKGGGRRAARETTRTARPRHRRTRKRAPARRLNSFWGALFEPASWREALSCGGEPSSLNTARHWLLIPADPRCLRNRGEASSDQSSADARTVGVPAERRQTRSINRSPAASVSYEPGIRA